VPKKSQTRWIIVVAGLVFFVVIIYTTLQQTRSEYEVCVTFGSGSHCATAKGATPDEAIHSAHDIDCGLLANGRDENIACMNTAATSIREIK
jgi:hypothetical protein